MKNRLYIIFYFLLLIPGFVFADNQATGIGQVAQNLIEPVNVLSDFIGTAAIVVGMSFIMGSFLKYLQYRINPLAVPISTVIMLLIMGVLLVCLPLAYKLTESGIPYSYSIKL